MTKINQSNNSFVNSWRNLNKDLNHKEDFVLPLFISNDNKVIQEIPCMPGIYKYGPKSAITYLDTLINKFGLKSVFLIPFLDVTEATSNADEIEQEENICDHEAYLNSEDNNKVETLNSSSSSSSTRSFKRNDHMPLPTCTPSSPSSSTTLSSVESSESGGSSSDNNNDDDDDSSTESVSSSVLHDRGQSDRLLPADDEAKNLTQNPFLPQTDANYMLLNEVNSPDIMTSQQQLTLGTNSSLKSTLVDFSSQSTSESTTRKTSSKESTPSSPANKPPPPPPLRQKEVLERQQKEQERILKQYGDEVRKLRRSCFKVSKKFILSAEHNPLLRLVPELRRKFPNLAIICDLSLDYFILNDFPSGRSLLRINDENVKSMQNLKLDKNSSSMTFLNKVDSNASQVLKVCRKWSLANLGKSSSDDMKSYSKRMAQSVNFDTSEFDLSVFTPSDATTITQESNFMFKNKCKMLGELAVEYARCGCNIVACIGSQQNRISKIRKALDKFLFADVAVLTIVSFASTLNGFARADETNAPHLGFKSSTSQLNPGSRMLALKAIDRDVKDGAEFVMVRPASLYLDIVRDVNTKYPDLPIAVYQAFGEFSMLKLASDANLIDLSLAVGESFTSARRSGASIIVSHFTPSILSKQIKCLSDSS